EGASIATPFYDGPTRAGTCRVRRPRRRRGIVRARSRPRAARARRRRARPPRSRRGTRPARTAPAPRPRRSRAPGGDRSLWPRAATRRWGRVQAVAHHRERRDERGIAVARRARVRGRDAPLDRLLPPLDPPQPVAGLVPAQRAVLAVDLEALPAVRRGGRELD